jgi:hypothetical protein
MDGRALVRETHHPLVAAPRRLVLLGASNLLRGFPTVLRRARAAWGGSLDVLAALGLGRSYGMRSAVLFRTLPPILDCGLWPALSARPPAATRALVTDVGNDIIYGAPPDQILEWVDTCLVRLRDAGVEIVLTGLPLPRLERLSRAGYVALLSIVYPRHRWLPFAVALERARVVDAGVRALAERHAATFVPSPLDWYGLDPIHVRPRRWRAAWSAILFAPDATTPVAEPAPPRGPSALRVYTLRPQRQWLFGRERCTAQPALTLPGGAVSLY